MEEVKTSKIKAKKVIKESQEVSEYWDELRNTTFDHYPDKETEWDDWCTFIDKYIIDTIDDYDKEDGCPLFDWEDWANDLAYDLSDQKFTRDQMKEAIDYIKSWVGEGIDNIISSEKKGELISASKSKIKDYLIKMNVEEKYDLGSDLDSFIEDMMYDLSDDYDYDIETQEDLYDAIDEYINNNLQEK